MATTRRHFADFTSVGLQSVANHLVAILPIAAVEQHGPHLPLGTDLIIADALTDAALDLVDASTHAARLPSLAFGKSDEHLGFPGTISLAADTMTKTLEEIGESLVQSGVRRMLIVSGHGGNSEVMGIAAGNLRRQHGMAVVATNFMRLGLPESIVGADEIRFGIHGGCVETSLMLHLRPDTVDMAAAADFSSQAQGLADDRSLLGFSGPGAMAWHARDLNAHGVVGNAKAATAKIGKAIAAHQAGQLAQLIGELAGFDPNRLNRP